jgi:hypothetical protein
VNKKNIEEEDEEEEEKRSWVYIHMHGGRGLKRRRGGKSA